MSAVTVHIPRRSNFTGVDRARILRAVDEIAGTDQLVVTECVFKLLTALADAVPVLRRLEHQYVFELLESSAQPSAEQGILCPVTLTQLRPVGLARVAQRRVLGIDAAVNDPDDDVFAVQPSRAAKAAVIVEQPEEIETGPGRKRAHLVFPDMQDLRKALQLVRLGGVHFRGKTVETVLVAIDQIGPGTGTSEDPVLLLGQACRITLNKTIGLVHADTRDAVLPGFG